MPQQGILITGTDTGVGKTFVACGLIGALRARGMRVAPFKPAETGCEINPQTGQLVPADAILLRQASGTEASLEAVCPYCFRLPLAPWIASMQQARGDEEEKDRGIDAAFLSWQFEELASAHDVVIVESAGGLLVPLAERFHFGDLARLLNLPVLLVAGSKLGVINHALLTLEYLAQADIPCLGVVLNHPSGDRSPAVKTNEAALRKLVKAPVFVLPHSSNGIPNPEELVFHELAGHIISALEK
jgi:dethiobiotin synthetase